MWEGDVWTANSYGSFLASDLLVGWDECWLALAVSSSLCETPSQKGRGWGSSEHENSHLLCVWAWVNNIIIFEAVIMCSSVGRAVAAGPPCLRQQVQLTIWQLTPMEGVIQSSWGKVDPVRAFRRSGPKPTNQRSSDTGGERKQHGGGAGDGPNEGRMPQLFSLSENGPSCCFSFLPVFCQCKVWFSFFFVFSLHTVKSLFSTSS